MLTSLWQRSLSSSPCCLGSSLNLPIDVFLSNSLSRFYRCSWNEDWSVQVGLPQLKVQWCSFQRWIFQIILMWSVCIELGNKRFVCIVPGLGCSYHLKNINNNNNNNSLKLGTQGSMRMVCHDPVICLTPAPGPRQYCKESEVKILLPPFLLLRKFVIFPSKWNPYLIYPCHHSTYHSILHKGCACVEWLSLTSSLLLSLSSLRKMPLSSATIAVWG